VLGFLEKKRISHNLFLSVDDGPPGPALHKTGSGDFFTFAALFPKAG